MECINLLLTQRIFKGDTELVKLVRKLSGVNVPLSVVVKCINRPINKYYVDKVDYPKLNQITRLFYEKHSNFKKQKLNIIHE